MPYFFLAGVAGPATEDVMQKILIHPDVIGDPVQHNWWDIGRHAGRYCRFIVRILSDTWVCTVGLLLEHWQTRV